MIIKNKILLTFLFTAAALTQAELPKEQIHSLYSQANQFFREANTATDPQLAERNYEQATLHFERIIDEGQVENGSTLMIDGPAREVRLDGVVVTGYTIGEFPRLAPGEMTLTYTDDPASSHLVTASIAHRDRWW